MTDMDRGKDYEPDIYATHEEDYDDFDVEEEEEGGSRAAIILLVVIGAVILLGSNFVTYRVAFQNGKREASVPHLQAANQGGKMQPENPGGMQPPQESALDKNVTGGSEEEFADLLPRGEEVVPPESESKSGSKSGSESESKGEDVPVIDIPTIGVDPNTESLEPEGAPESVPVEAPKPPKPQPAAPKPQPAEPKPAPSTSNSTPGKIMVPKPGAIPGPSDSGPSHPATIPAPAPSEPSTSSVPAPSGPAPSASTSGEYVVQLASLPSQDAADAAWRNISAKYSDLLGNAFRDVQEADLGDRGIFYRLRVGYFESKSEANRLCDTLKSRGQDCLVKNR